jgi:lysophospholipid acyltransferase (LPLAT)-like uncharacterized protein
MAARPLKTITRSEWARGLLCWLGAGYIRLVWTTGRWTVIGGEAAESLWRAEKPFILCFWHGRLMMMPYCWDPRMPIHVLISEHRDGQILARTVGHLGIRTLIGSTTRGGSQALRAMVRLLRDGGCIGITPDGPQGPRMRASVGVIQLARLAGVPILPITFAASRRRLLGSWDRFLLALPFARGVIHWGTPLEVPADADPEAMEACRAELEAALNALCEAADTQCNTAPVAPAPAAPAAEPNEAEA